MSKKVKLVNPTTEALPKESTFCESFDTAKLWHTLSIIIPTVLGVVAMTACGVMYAKVIDDVREARYFLSGITVRNHCPTIVYQQNSS